MQENAFSFIEGEAAVWVTCFPTAGAPKDGNAVVPPPATKEGLSPKSGKILVGLKLLNTVLGF